MSDRHDKESSRGEDPREAIDNENVLGRRPSNGLSLGQPLKREAIEASPAVVR